MNYIHRPATQIQSTKTILLRMLKKLIKLINWMMEKGAPNMDRELEMLEFYMSGLVSSSVKGREKLHCFNRRLVVI